MVRRRLEAQLARYRLTHVDVRSASSRVRVLAADVELRLFGLPPAEYAALARTVQLVYHCAAHVSGALPYRALHPANVVGTRRVVELVLLRGGPPAALLHVSTMGFLPAGHAEVLDVPDTDGMLLARSGYAQSKWVGERVVCIAARHFGLRTYVVRPGAVCGDSASGASNPRDSTSLLLRGLVQERSVCTEERTPLPRHFNLCHVDYVARAIGELGAELCKQISEPRAFHLCAPTSLSLEQLHSWLILAGHELTELSADQFCRRVVAAAEDHPLFALKSVLGTPVNGPPDRIPLPVEPCARNADRAVPALAMGPRALTPAGLALSLRFLLADDQLANVGS